MGTQVIEGLAVEIEGNGPAVVCVHGLGGSSNTWTPLIPALQGYQVIRIDLPGSGRSLVSDVPVSIESMVVAVASVCQHLEVNEAIFLGHSMGSIICQHLAVTHSRLVRGLVLFGPLLCPPDAGRESIRVRAAKADTGGLSAIQEIADAIVNGATAYETKMRQPAVLALIRESVMRQPAAGYAQSCAALADAQAAAVEKIAVPTLLITGDQDAVAPPAVMQAMAKAIAGSQQVVLAGCGHWTTFEQPQECMREMSKFLSSFN